MSVPLRQVSTIEGGWNEGQIVRRNGVRTLSVFAEVTRGTNQNAMQKRIERVMESRIIPTLPEGVTYEYGGAKELDFETMNPLMQGLAIAVIIVFFFLLVNFKKIGLALAALSSLLLTLFGAALGLWAFHIDFSLTCVLGVISLIGIVVRNAILIFEHAQDLRLHKHYSPRDAAFDAGRRRHAPDLPDLGYNGRGRGAHDHQRQFPLDADGCGDLLGNGLLDDLGGHHPACFLLEDIRE